MQYLLYLVPLIGFLSLIYTFFKYSWVSKQPAGEDKMQHIANNIARGANAFLKAEYKSISIFVIIVSAILYYIGIKSPDQHPLIVISFIIGSIFSALAGYIGMRVATKSNVRTTQAARSSLAKAFS